MNTRSNLIEPVRNANGCIRSEPSRNGVNPCFADDGGIRRNRISRKPGENRSTNQRLSAVGNAIRGIPFNHPVGQLSSGGLRLPVRRGGCFFEPPTPKTSAMPKGNMTRTPIDWEKEKWCIKQPGEHGKKLRVVRPMGISIHGEEICAGIAEILTSRSSEDNFSDAREQAIARLIAEAPVMFELLSDIAYHLSHGALHGGALIFAEDAPAIDVIKASLARIALHEALEQTKP